MSHDVLRILVIGAHPDDCDIHAGGSAALWRAAGHSVRFVSVTNGESGHHEQSGAALADRRRAEAGRAGEVLGIPYDVLDHRDGSLQPDLPTRLELIGLIRRHAPDLILTHRPNDYHPDHRYTSQLVCDAAYMVTVPPIVPVVPALRRNPVIAYLADSFHRPYPFSPTVVVDIEPVLERVVDMLDCHVSQFYEWLPFNQCREGEVPAGHEARRAWLRQQYLDRIGPLAEQFREQLIETYGPLQGQQIRWIEAFEPCEYGSPLDAAARRRLFPFVPSSRET
jgi:LmbE family N-acetylglucosaminyl deacetylase